jgi:SecD/SecF fusion protein
MPRAAFSQIVNRSMSEVLTRSLATSFCTLLPVLALMLFGGATLQDFAFALLVGTASGTYSSIFIAGPVLTHWKERETVYRQRARRIVEQFGFVPAYATGADGKAIEATPEQRKEGQRRASLTAPSDPTQVSREEFDAMVRDIQEEVVEERDAHERQPAPAPARGSEDLSPEDVVMPKPERDRQRRQRNKRHGRPR